MIKTEIKEKMMTALFTDPVDGVKAYQELLNRSYDRDEISILMSEETRNELQNTGIEPNMPSKAVEGTGVGAAIGGTVGAIIAAVAAIGSNIVIPGLGLVVAGPLAAALVGAGAGGATGGLIGALIGSGIPEQTAQEYEIGLRQGGIILGFRPHSAQEANEIANAWTKYNGKQIFPLEDRINM